MKNLLLVVFCLSAGFANAQEMLVPKNNPRAVVRGGESEIHINNSEGSRRYPLVIYVNGDIKAHIPAGVEGSIEKLIVKNGTNIVTAQLSEWNKKTGAWEMHRQKETVTCSSNSNSITLKVTNLLGILAMKIDSTLPLAGGTTSQSSRFGDIDAVIKKTGDNLVDLLPERALLAITNISCDESDISDYIIEELEEALVSSGYFRVVDRRSLDDIRREQNFQASDEVDDGRAIASGQLLGASIVIVGTVSEVDTLRRLRIRALDVKTGSVVATIAERF
jgi:hypothetical protein